MDLFTMLAFCALLQSLGCSAGDCPVKPGPLRWVCVCRRAAANWVTMLSSEVA